MLDVAAKLDQCAEYLFPVSSDWSHDGELIAFPPPFGQTQTPEERHVAELDARTGASLKLRVLNPQARVWTLSAGGGASVVYADTVCELAAASGALDCELANYGEYSGDPTEAQLYDYASTILRLMTTASPPHPQGVSST